MHRRHAHVVFALSLVLPLLAGCSRGSAPASTNTDATPPPSTATAVESEGAVDTSTPASPATIAYVSESDPSIRLSLTTAGDGTLTGSLTDGSQSMPVRARRGANGFSGTVGPEGTSTPIRGTDRGDGLALEVGSGADAEHMTFRRAAAAGATAGQPAVTAGPVMINGTVLTTDDLARIQQRYHLRIPAAAYWYDHVLGAWGPAGGPTAGFLPAGLELGGALRADASAGNTGVFINGRQLPQSDLLALQGITGPIPPGRYFITAQGLAGYEGGPPQWNLYEIARANGGGGGGSHTWQSRLSSGFSDGTTGAVFLPNGGIVSTGN